jgi:Cft2 family RNA processing exonuclease
MSTEERPQGSPEQPESAGGMAAARTAEILFEKVVGERLPSESLDAESVPSEAMTVALDAAIVRLVEHSRFCKESRCHHLPPRLYPFRRMRQKAIERKRREVHDALWSDPEHEFVQSVREDILTADAALADAVESGAALEPEEFAAILDEPRDAARLVAVLWARGLEVPDEALLFRRLVALQADPTRARAKATEDASKSASTAELKKAQRELKRVNRELREAKKTVADRERGIARRAEELAAAQGERDEALSESAALRDDLARQREASERVQTDLDRLTRVNGQLRTEVNRAQTERSDVERAQSKSVGELAAAQKEIARLRAELKGMPSGAEAVWRFIKDEEDRINIARTIDQGADRQRAESEHAELMKLERAFKAAYPEYSEDRPPAPIVRKASLGFSALGGGREVGRSAYMVSLGGRRILVDCGVKVGARDDADFSPDLDAISTLDAAVITHAHTDHIGWLPALVRKFPEIELYCTHATAELLPTMLRDGANHYLARNELRRTHATYDPGAPEVIDAYEREDVEETLFHLIGCEFGEIAALPIDDITVQFHPAGHILGASSVLLEGGGRRIFLSGDISSEDQLTVAAAAWPSEMPAVDLLVLESTYGSKRRESAESARADLVGKIKEITTRGQGSVILASFALGRAQELLTVVHDAMEAGELPRDIPVCIDGMIRAINETYLAHDALRLPPESFTVGSRSEREDAVSRAKTTPTIIVTTSGMLAGGPVIEYSRRLLEDPRHRLILTGYQDEAAPSRMLRNFTKPGTRSKDVELPAEDGGTVRFKAAAAAIDVGLSAHADQAGLAAYAGKIPAGTIALVHGEPGSQGALREQILREHPELTIECGPVDLTVG